MTSLLTNNAAMTALTTLKSIGRQLDATSNRVATGQRVSAASDNAAYWSIATAMRTDNASLSAVKDSLGLGASSVDIAYNGLTSVLGDLTNLRAKLQTALTPGVDRSKVQVEIDALQDKMKATAQASSASGQNWLSVNSADSSRYRSTQTFTVGFSRSASGGITPSQASIPVSDIALYDAGTSMREIPATPARVTAGSALTGTTDFSGPNAVRFSVSLDGSAARDVVLNRTMLASAVPDLARVTAQDLTRAIANQIAADPVLAGGVRVGLDDGGRLYFETTGTGAARSLVVDRVGGGGTGPNLVANAGFESGMADWSSTGDTSYAGTGTGYAHNGSSSYISGTSGGTNHLSQTIATVAGQSYQIEFWLYGSYSTPNSFMAKWDGATQIAIGNVSNYPYTRQIFTAVATGSSTTIMFDFQQPFGFWAIDDVSVTAAMPAVTLGFGSGGNAHAAGYGSPAHTAASRGILDTLDGNTGATIGTLDITGQDESAIKAMIQQVDLAIGRVTDAGTNLGSSKTLIDGHRTFVDALMKANDRTIGILVDADLDEESAKLKALQTQQQLAMQSLSIANAASQTLISLFR
ncbi:flagellin [Methylobacterium tarhaniae]|uniref:flagellin N-terminal helical domain-containing protein n=1 Tax=Methylobacterium tarhaniae TaxID=1187852 RepID=UPI003D005AB6